jgi:hypothetical protein
MANTDKQFHLLTRTLLQEALTVRSLATSDDLDGVWRHARRTARACQALLLHLDGPSAPLADPENPLHRNNNSEQIGSAIRSPKKGTRHE